MPSGLSPFGYGDYKCIRESPHYNLGGAEFGHLAGREGRAKRFYGIALWEMEDSVLF